MFGYSLLSLSLCARVSCDQGFVPAGLNWLIIDWADIFQVI